MRGLRTVGGAAVLAGALALLPTVASGQTGPPGFQPFGVVGSLQSSPDSAGHQGSAGADVVVRGDDNGIYWAESSNGSSWSGWNALGAPPGGAQGDPTVVTWAPGRLDVFVRGADNKLWQTFRTGELDPWSPWIKPVGDEGTLASGPDASSRGTGRLDVFVRGTDNQVYQRFFENGTWNDAWIGHGDPAGETTLVGDPTSAARGSVLVDIFARGSDDKLWQRSWNGSAWAEWVRPVGADGTLASSPDATSFAFGSGLMVFARGTDGGVWRVTYTGNQWFSWFRTGRPGDVILDGPGVSSRQDGSFVDVFVRGIDDRNYMLTIVIGD